ncbi:MAG: PfaD family polyunsaturated fatty acid/polyketide biosynthesis protein [Pseudomonadota bacterium]
MTPHALGSQAFRDAYGLTYAYVAGAMVKGISSVPLVIRLARAGMLGFFGTGGVPLDQTTKAVKDIQSALAEGQSFGVNVLADPGDSKREMALIDQLIALNVPVIEASAFMELSKAVVKFRLQGAKRIGDRVETQRNVLAKLSRPEVATQFLSPAPAPMVQDLLEHGHITPEEAEAAPLIPVATDITVEADSGGHTDMGVTSTLLPTMLSLRDQMRAMHGYDTPVRIGLAGGIGTPAAAAAGFVMGADYIATGSINQCTPEAGNSDAVKDLLQTCSVQDTAYAPAGDMFEIGAKVQVVKKGLFFPARGNKLHEIWRSLPGLEHLPGAVARDIQDRYLGRSFDAVFEETCAHYEAVAPEEITKAKADPKVKMALIFRWYFVHSMRLALAGDTSQKVNWQVYCGPSLGAFNNWVAGSDIEDWHTRHVDMIGERLMIATAEYLSKQLGRFATAV